MSGTDSTKILYTTLEKEASAEFCERKSVFIGHARPVKTDAEAMDFVRRIKEKYKDARHNVYAYYLSGGASARLSDDGEPQGSAGIPVMEVIKKSGATDCAVAVTRYFGGILLGAAGLVRAYSTAASLAVQAARVVTYEQYGVFSLECSYADYNKIAFELEIADAVIDKCVFLENVCVEYAVKTDVCDALSQKIKELSGGRISPVMKGTRFDCK